MKKESRKTRKKSSRRSSATSPRLRGEGRADKVKIIANPISGHGRSLKLVEELSGELERRGMKAEVTLTKAKGDATSAGKDVDDTYLAVCAVGGDGTMNEVLNGIAELGVSLAIMPAGLSNVLAVELGLEARADVLAQAILEGTCVDLDLCVADGRYFAAMGGAGWDAHIVHTIAASRSSPLGFPGYVLPAARSLVTYKFPYIKVVLDGETVSEKAGLVIVGNVKQYGGPFQITNRADFNDGLLDIYIVRRASPLEMLKLYAGVLWGDHTRHGNTSYLRGRKLELTSSGEVPVHIDGEAAGYLPKTFEITGRKQRIVVPQ